MLDRVVFDLDTIDAEAFFEYAGYRARRMREPLKRAGNIWLRHVNRTFATEGDAAGIPWEDLTEKWRRRKAKIRPGTEDRILYLWGRLQYEAISERSIHVSDDELRYEVFSEYAQFHQYGGPGFNDSWVPARPWAVVTPDVVEEVEDAFVEWVEEIRRVAVYFGRRRGSRSMLGDGPMFEVRGIL